MLFARLMPIKHAARHKIIFNNILPIALNKLPCSIRANVSREKVENVVNPPSTPTNMAIRISSETLTRSINTNDKNPINKEPTTFTIKVPYGKLAPNHCADCT